MDGDVLRLVAISLIRLLSIKSEVDREENGFRNKILPEKHNNPIRCIEKWYKINLKH